MLCYNFWSIFQIINFYMELLRDRGKKDNFPSVHVFNTFFYPKVMSNGHQGVRRWTKQVDIFSMDYIVVPVHLGMHWCMSVSFSTFDRRFVIWWVIFAYRFTIEKMTSDYHLFPFQYFIWEAFFPFTIWKDVILSWIFHMYGCVDNIQ